MLEFQESMRRMGQSLSPNQAAEVMAELDLDGSGTIGVSEASRNDEFCISKQGTLFSSRGIVYQKQGICIKNKEFVSKTRNLH